MPGSPTSSCWDVCDQVTDLFLPCRFLEEAIRDYVADEREFVRRAGFTLIAARAARDKKAGEIRSLPICR